MLGLAEYPEALLAKLSEEAQEVRDATGEAEQLGELADLQEILNALAESCGSSPLWVQEGALKKRQERCGSRQRIFLESTTPA